MRLYISSRNFSIDNAQKLGKILKLSTLVLWYLGTSRLAVHLSKSFSQMQDVVLLLTTNKPSLQIANEEPCRCFSAIPKASAPRARLVVLSPSLISHVSVLRKSGTFRNLLRFRALRMHPI